MICENCVADTNRITIIDGEMFHRCRANESSCVEGKDCPDYIEHCDCKDCYIALGA